MTPRLKIDRNHHRPRVERGRLHSGHWFAGCVCGFLRMEPSWRLALVKANRHAEELS